MYSDQLLSTVTKGYSGDIKLYFHKFAKGTKDAKMLVPDDDGTLCWQEFDDQAHYPACLSFDDGEAQSLLDGLLRVGVRPSSGEGNTGQLGATREHLSDMRKIAFSKLRIDHE